MKNQNKNEQGFVLISVIMLMFILTIVAIAATTTSQTEVKVSAMVANTSRAFAAAKAGLAENYATWKFNLPVGGASSFTAVRNAVDAGTATASNYIAALHPNNMAEFTTAAGGDIDAYIQGSAFIDVFDVQNGTMTPVANNTWNTGTGEQVAVWSASYTKQSDPNYPYQTFNTGSCKDCSIAVYALGRFGRSHSLQREIQATTTRKIGKVSAITNAPQTAYWADLCNGSNGSTVQSTSNPFGVVVPEGHNPPPPFTPSTTTTAQHDWMIEATQAEYQIFTNPSIPKNYNIPSGVAYASNTAAGVGNAEFEAKFPILSGENTSSVAVYDKDPNIMYSGHKTTSDVRVYRASQTRDLTSPNAQNLDTIGGKLPYQLVNDRLLGGSGQLNLINGSGQVFELDALRWGAEQFTCRTTGSSSNSAPNGKFCSKAESLRQAVHAGRVVRNSGSVVMGDPNAAPVTGRMTYAEFQYNVANAVPMFGIIRVMYPAIPDLGPKGNGICNGVSTQLYKTEDASEKMNWSAGNNDYDGSPTSKDTDGSLGPRAKLIVYGSITIDFFADNNGNFLFDPASGEHVLATLENGEAKAEMFVPELINPALPYMTSGALKPFPLAGGGTIATGTNANPINHASPTGGWFPTSEGMVPSGSGLVRQKDGRMELMNPNGSGLSKLLEVGNSIGSTGGTGAAGGYFSTYKTRLQYYYGMMVAVADHADPNQWPISTYPGSMGENFCIGQDDCNITGPNHNGDKVHLLFPSGYMHGWKVALTALGMHATEWNAMLTGIDNLAGLVSTDSSPATKGSPFNTTTDTGVAKALDMSVLTGLIPNQKVYYYTDAGTSDYPLLTANWADVPAFIYSGGNMQIQHTSNVSGIIYTPESMAWGADDNSSDPGTGYFNGAIITGFGFSRGNEDPVANGYAAVVFDPQSVDNAATDKINSNFIRYAWENL